MSHRDLRPIKTEPISFSLLGSKKKKKKIVKKEKSASLARLSKVEPAVRSAANILCTTVSATTGIPKKVCLLAADSLIAAGKSIDFGSIKSKAKSLMVRGGESMRGQKIGQPFALSGPVTSAPVAISHQIKRTNKPRMSVRGDGVCIAHSEMLGSIMSGNVSSNVTLFRAIGMRANPGISSVFPWLSSVAVNYEKYRFKRLTFSIVPLVSTQFSGRIGVGFDYDSSDLPPGNRQEFYSLSTHSETMPWQATSVSVKCDPNFKFTGTHVAADNKLIDQGQVILMSDSVSNGTSIVAAIPLYDLIVDYEVELIEPQQALFATQAFVTTSNLTPGVGLATGTDPTIASGPNIITGTLVTGTKLSFLLPAGSYSLASEIVFTAGGPSIVVNTASAGVTIKTVESHAGGTSVSLTVVTSSTDMQIDFNLSGTNFTANVGKLDFLISRVASPVVINYVV